VTKVALARPYGSDHTKKKKRGLIMWPLLALVLVATVGETLYVVEGSAAQPLAWEDASSWTFENGTAAGRVPVGTDDLVFRDTRGKTWGTSFVLIGAEVTVRSVLEAGRTIARGPKGKDKCQASLVVGSAGWLHAEVLNATTGGQVLLLGGQVSCPSLFFDSGSMLGGVGRVDGEVVLRGSSVLVVAGRK
jgi:hypothetical protein